MSRTPLSYAFLEGYRAFYAKEIRDTSKGEEWLKGWDEANKSPVNKFIEE